MNKTASTVSQIHTISFTLFFIINTILDYFIYPLIKQSLNSEFLVIFISTIISAVLYSVIYFIMSALFKFFIFKVKDKKLNIGGKWYHIHIPYTSEGEQVKTELRCGEIEIEQKFFDIKSIKAKNYSYGVDESGEPFISGDRVTEWKYANNFVLEDNKIVEIYKTNATHDKKITVNECPVCMSKFSKGKTLTVNYKDRVGVHDLTIESEDLISGQYRDSYPSLTHGIIKFFRKKEDRDEEIRKYFKRIKAKKSEKIEANSTQNWNAIEQINVV